jgi:phthiocerol/phenolphthiocerol synthesis type-I polyketide synthase B
MKNMLTKAEIREWIVAWLSRELKIDRAAIDSVSTFADLGMGSRQAVMLSADLEAFLEREFPPDLLWQYSSLDQLIDHLAPT